MTPVPHPHNSGNMWQARCEYVAKLHDPRTFGSAMTAVAARPVRGAPPQPMLQSCRGAGRFSAEHWIHSHPDVQPCDLYTDPAFTWNYSPLPEGDFTKVLQPAPRYDLSAYIKNEIPCGQAGQLRQERLDEYAALYGGAKPPASWWGWPLLQGDRAPQCWTREGWVLAQSQG